MQGLSMRFAIVRPSGCSSARLLTIFRSVVLLASDDLGTKMCNLHRDVHLLGDFDVLKRLAATRWLKGCCFVKLSDESIWSLGTLRDSSSALLGSFSLR